MRSFLVAAVLLLGSAAALAFEVSESMLNEYVAQGLARKTTRDVQLLDPKVTLQDGYATLCARLSSTFFANPVDFCADLTPTWRQESGSLLASKMMLVSLDVPGVAGKDVDLVKTLINRLVLPGLEGVEVYRADNHIGKQVSWMKVLPGKLEMGF